MDKIHVVFVSNRKYINLVYIALTSLLFHHPDGNLEINLIHPDLNEDDFRRFDSLQKIGKFDFRPLHIDINEFHSQWGVSLPTYFRLAILTLRPDLSKVIYLDCDIVLLDDIAKLWDYPLDGKSIGAIGDRAGKKVASRIKVPAERYFNAGVLVMNLEKMRANNAEELLIRTLRERDADIYFLDQDLLNICYTDDLQLLPQKWNIINSVYRNLPVPGMYTTDDIIAALKDPGIVHYTGTHKPWLFWKTTHHPYAPCFWHYALQAPIPWQLKCKVFCKRLVMSRLKDSSVIRPWDESILKTTM